MIKIQLDAKALDRLIGGDSEVEVELRNAVVQEFGKKRLKDVSNTLQGFFDAQVRLIRESIEKEMTETLFDPMQGSTWGSMRYVFKKKIKAQLSDEIEALMDRELRKLILEKVNERFDALNKHVDAYCDAAIERYTARTLDKMVDVKFRALLAELKDKKKI